MKTLTMIAATLACWILLAESPALFGQTSFHISSKTTGDTLFTIDSSGRVGINTTSPGFLLDMRSKSIDLSGILRIGNSDLSHYLRFYSGRSNTPNPIIMWNMGDSLRLGTSLSGFSEWMRIASNGYVGIGTMAPRNRLEVADTIFSSSGGFKFPDGTVQITAAGAGLWSSSGNHLYSTNTGNVGIGNTSPINKLDVDGKIGIRDSQIVYLPDQVTFQGSLFLGTGGNNLYNPGGSYSHGQFNTAVGLGALYRNYTGFKNTAVGYHSLFSNLGDPSSGEGSENTAIGYQTLFSNTLGSGNTATGYQALYSVTTANDNTAHGYQALYSNLGKRNTAFGYRALYYHSHYDENTAVGYMAGYLDGYSGFNGSGNTLVGAYAGKNIDGGSNNTIIGYRAGEGFDFPAPTFSGNVIIGAFAGRFDVTQSNRLIIDNQNTTAPLIYGEFDTDKLKINGRLEATDTIFSRSGGFRFPDGSVQTTASVGGSKWLGDTDIYYSAGKVGIGATAPLTRLHVLDQSIALPVGALVNESISIENSDACLGLYSDNGGNYGSVVSLGEVVSGGLTNKWGIYRTTSIASPGNQLRFSFGINANYALNATWMSISANGRVGIGTTAPLHKLHITDTMYVSAGGYKFPDGSVQTTAAIGGGSGVTLDQAYDQGGPGAGRTIIADAGAFQVSGVDGALFSGTFGSGTLPASGAGTRMMWYPGKGAFRAGTVANQWDIDSIGNNSFASGYRSMAKGSSSTALGSSTIASNIYSTAMGWQTTASGQTSTAIGQNTIASGLISTAMGWYTLATGLYSTAMGRRTVAVDTSSISMGDSTIAQGRHSMATGWCTKALGLASTTFGFNTSATGEYAIAMGRANSASGANSMTAGYQNTASGISSMAMGYQCSTVGDYSMAMGYSVIAQSYASVALGRYNDTAGVTNSWDVDDPLFVIGNGTVSTRSNALTILKNGNVGINTEIPTTSLDVNGVVRIRSVITGVTPYYDLAVTADGTVCSMSSDKRLKENIVPIKKSLEKVLQLQGMNFSWIADSTHARKIGFIAQDVEKVLPEVVFTNKNDGYKGINYNEIAAVLTEAIKEQQKQIQELRAELEKMKEQMSNLK
ncbi:tail fiber domain-containing protein [bacterium]|nr:tail fiber domain-containing protein [bacterium]